MGFERVSGVRWTCDSCGKEEMAPDQKNADETLIPPKGWLTGNARESSGDRATEDSAVGYVVCSVSHISPAVKRLFASLAENAEKEE